MSVAPDGGLRMRDLCRETGLDRQAIHFYIKEGLLPPGEKTGRNMAWYTPTHVRRLKLIRKLQHERFLPLKAIRGILDDVDDGFSDRQRRFLAEVRGRLGSDLAPRAEPETWVDAQSLIQRCVVEEADLARMAELGFVRVTGEGEARTIAQADVWRVELWGRLRASGFSAAMGFSVDDVAIYDTTIRRLVRHEASMVSDRLEGLEPDQAAAMVQAALPLIHELMLKIHTDHVRDLLATL